MNDEIIYFELNNWTIEHGYPACSPFIEWMLGVVSPLLNENWCKEQKICVVVERVDLSLNFKVTATRKWVEENCPCLLEKKYSKFVHQLEDDYDDDDKEYFEAHGYGEGPFLKYCEENFGMKVWDYDLGEWFDESKYIDNKEDTNHA